MVEYTVASEEGYGGARISSWLNEHKTPFKNESFGEPLLFVEYSGILF